MKILAIASLSLLSLKDLPLLGAEEVKYRFEKIEFRKDALPKIEIELTIPASNEYYPNLVAVDDVVIHNMGASVKVVERKEESLTLLVGIDCGQCEDLMEGDFSWELAKVSGPEVALAKDQKFLPLIYFKYCMIGIGVGSEVVKDRHIQNWLSDAAVASRREGKLAGRKHAEQGSAGQPATRSESNSQGNKKPQPESERRSR